MRITLLVSALAASLLSLSACTSHPSDEPVAVQITPAQEQQLGQIIGQAVARAMGSSPKMGATTSSPNFNTTDFQNQMGTDFEPNGSVTWIADGGTFSDGGRRVNVAVPTLPGKLWKSFWIDCAGGTNQAAQLLFVDGIGSGGVVGQQKVPIMVPCDTGPLSIVPSAFYQDGTDAGLVTIYPIF